MNIGWMIFWAGLGTYLMRSTGVWLPHRWIPTRWLAHLPLAVILVMAIASLAGLTPTPQDAVSTLLAGAAVAIATLKRLPLAVCILIGCVVFGALTNPMA